MRTTAEVTPTREWTRGSELDWAVMFASLGILGVEALTPTLLAQTAQRQLHGSVATETLPKPTKHKVVLHLWGLGGLITDLRPKHQS